MEIKILAFGIARDIVGQSNFEFSVKESTTVGELKEALIKKYPNFEKLRSLAIAVNSDYASDDQVVGLGDEIVIIPPVSGG